MSCAGRAEDEVSKAAQLLVDHDVSALPVLDGRSAGHRNPERADLLIAKRSARKTSAHGGSRPSTPASALAFD